MQEASSKYFLPNVSDATEKLFENLVEVHNCPFRCAVFLNYLLYEKRNPEPLVCYCALFFKIKLKVITALVTMRFLSLSFVF